jgi:hypothetical protein
MSAVTASPTVTRQMCNGRTSLLLVEPLNASKRQAIQAPFVKHGFDYVAPRPEQEVGRQITAGLARYAARGAFGCAHGAEGTGKRNDFANAGYGSHSHV